MSSSPHLFVALSGHGFGHLAQTGPVLNTLRQRQPALRLTVQSSLPSIVLHNRIHGDFDHIPEATDVGLLMASAVDIRLDASLAAYRAFHADWDARLARQQALLERLAPDLVLVNVPYLPLAAAARLGLPAVALCSLNWADIVQSYWPAEADVVDWCQTMRAAYNSARRFLRPLPAMPMSALRNTRAIGPIAALGQDRRAELNARLGLSDQDRLLLAGLGGFELPLALADWPATPGLHWLVPAGGGMVRADLHHREQVSDIPFIDLLRSCDVLLTKPGYGSFAEAVCNGRPVLYVERDDWPETPWLVSWLEQYGNALPLSRERLRTGTVADTVQALLAQPSRPALTPTGADEAADGLQRLLADGA